MEIDQAATINQIILYEISIPLKKPFQISGGTLYKRKSLIIELSDGEEIGYGESAPFEGPFYSSETISTVKSILIEHIFGKIIGGEIKSIEEFNKIISENIRGNNFAKAGIETAYWDLIARKNNISLQDLIYNKLKEMGTPNLFLKKNNYIESGVAIGIPESLKVSELKKWIYDYLEEGYRRVKIKIRPGWDQEPIKVTRDIVGFNFPFWVDANSSYGYPQHLSVFQHLDQYNCLFIEQPLNYDDILDHTKLSKQIKTPICLDESLKNVNVAKHIIELETSKIWNMKIQRVGGLLEACKIYKLGVQNGVELWGGTMPESGIGAMFIIALASFNGFKYPSDVEPSTRWYGHGNDLIEIKMDQDGKIYLSEAIGIGEINRKYLEKYGEIIHQYRYG